MMKGVLVNCSIKRFPPRLLHVGLAITVAAGLAVGLVFSVRAQAPEPATPTAQTDLRLNELMADNNTTLADPDEPGEAPDWIELYNPTDAPISLDGLALTDDEENPGKFPITDGLTIPAFGFLIFYADDDPRQGPLHTNFRLGADGEYVGLYRLDPLGKIDDLEYPALETDQAYGRLPNGLGSFQILQFATPGASNGGDPPRIADVSKPPVPAPADQPITVTATITDIDAIVAVQIVYTAGGSSELTAPMVKMGGDTYAGQIPGQAANTLVSYYVRATDEDGESNRLPLPGSERRYLAGYTPPPLILNEIVYWNFIVPDPDEPAEFPDWIEIYNPTNAAISMNGLSLSDNKDEPLKYVIPNGVIVPANGRIVFLADDDSGQGPTHLNFGLKAEGEYVGLYGGQGTVKIDSYDQNTPARIGAAGRIPDGSPAQDAWSDTVCPTFELPNRDCNFAQFLPAVMK
jgi:hypothetical protein